MSRLTTLTLHATHICCFVAVLVHFRFFWVWLIISTTVVLYTRAGPISRFAAKQRILELILNFVWGVLLRGRVLSSVWCGAWIRRILGRPFLIIKWLIINGAFQCYLSRLCFTILVELSCEMGSTTSFCKVIETMSSNPKASNHNS